MCISGCVYIRRDSDRGGDSLVHLAPAAVVLGAAMETERVDGYVGHLLRGDFHLERSER